MLGQKQSCSLQLVLAALLVAILPAAALPCVVSENRGGSASHSVWSHFEASPLVDTLCQQPASLGKQQLSSWSRQLRQIFSTEVGWWALHAAATAPGRDPSTIIDLPSVCTNATHDISGSLEFGNDFTVSVSDDALDEWHARFAHVRAAQPDDRLAAVSRWLREVMQGNVAITILNIHSRHPLFREAARSIRRQTGHDVHMSLTVLNATGAAESLLPEASPTITSDNRFVQQLGGCMRWTVWPSSIVLPLEDVPQRAVNSFIRAKESVSTVLCSGHALYVPRGWGVAAAVIPQSAARAQTLAYAVATAEATILFGSFVDFLFIEDATLRLLKSARCPCWTGVERLRSITVGLAQSVPFFRRSLVFPHAAPMERIASLLTRVRDTLRSITTALRSPSALAARRIAHSLEEFTSPKALMDNLNRWFDVDRCARRAQDVVDCVTEDKSEMSLRLNVENATGIIARAAQLPDSALHGLLEKFVSSKPDPIANLTEWFAEINCALYSCS